MATHLLQVLVAHVRWLFARDELPSVAEDRTAISWFGLARWISAPERIPEAPPRVPGRADRAPDIGWRWLFERDDLPLLEPPPDRAGRSEGLATWFFRREPLPASEPEVRKSGGFHALGWLFARERIPDPAEFDRARAPAPHTPTDAKKDR